MSDMMDKYETRLNYEKLFEMDKWCREIPYINFPKDVLIQVIPPFCGAVVRFCVSNLEKTKSVSVYLDCYNNLGIVGKPYWELYPAIDGDTYRCAMEDTDELIEKVLESLNETKNIKEDEKTITKFYTYSQNNTGGSWINNEDVCEYVIVEANNYEHANWLAENNYGLYFDGCSQGMDCNCCGDRWTEQWDEDDGYDEPKIYGKSVFETEKSFHRKKCIIHYLDGRKEKIEFK